MYAHGEQNPVHSGLVWDDQKQQWVMKNELSGAGEPTAAPEPSPQSTTDPYFQGMQNYLATMGGNEVQQPEQSVNPLFTSTPGGAGKPGQPPPTPAPAPTPTPPPGANPRQPMRLILVNPETGVVDTGMSDGSDPQQYESLDAALAANPGIPYHIVGSADEAINIVREQTGDSNYSGYGPNYQPPGAPPPEYTPPQLPPPTGTAPTPAPPPGGTPPPGTGPGGLEDIFGLEPIPEIPRIDLGDMPLARGGWHPGFQADYDANAENYRNRINQTYGDQPFTNMTAAQHDLGGVPQPQNSEVANFQALERLLSGQGFDPATLAKMKANATDDISAEGRAGRGNARLAAEQAGLAGSPAALAMEAQAGRREGDARTRAMSDIDIQDAMEGLNNLRLGSGMELQRGTTNANNANMMALQNASNMLSAMSQNVANMQQTNQINTQNEQDRKMTSAGKQSDFMSQAGQNFNTASTAKAIGADEQNAANSFNWRLNQAGMDRDRDQFNTGNKMQRYGWDSSNLINLINGTQANAFWNAGNSMASGQDSSSPWGAVLRNIGGGILDAGIKKQFGATA